MDQQTSTDFRQTPPATPQPTPQAPKVGGKKKSMLAPVLLVIIVLAAGAAGYFAMQASKESKDKKTAQATVTSLTKELTDTKKDLDDAKAAAAKTTTTPATTGTVSAALKQTISDAITSKNTAALQGYMATSVTVVIAGSEKGGAETAALAVKDLDYVSTGTAPWNFSLSAATLTGFKAGSYGKYFGSDSYAGQSANKYVVSFAVDTAGKINTVFMTNNADLLAK